VSWRTPIEHHLRTERFERSAFGLVVRGWPLTIEGLLRNADACRSRYSWRGKPLVAVSAELAADRWAVGAVLVDPRLVNRSRYAAAPVRSVLRRGFTVLPTFGAPHVSIVLPNYDERSAAGLLDVLGDVRRNPFYDVRGGRD